jgi:hypothetical protein
MPADRGITVKAEDSQAQAQAQLSLLRSEDEARAWVLEQVAQCESTRQSIDASANVRMQRKLFCQWMIYQGRALGSLVALLRCGRISEVAYTELRQRVVETRKPTIIPFVPTMRG